MSRIRGNEDDVQGNGNVIRKPTRARPTVRGGADDAAGNAKKKATPKIRAAKKATPRTKDDTAGHKVTTRSPKKAAKKR